MMQGPDQMAMVLMSFLPFFLFSIPFAIGAYFVAGRIGSNQVLWVVLTLIPFVNFIFYIYAMFAILLYVLDRLNAVAPPPPVAAAGPPQAGTRAPAQPSAGATAQPGATSDPVERGPGHRQF